MKEFEDIYKEMEEEFERNHPLLIRTYEKYKTLQDISDEWRKLRKPIIITETSDGTKVKSESE